ncbi:threonine-phosphate decarboxylase CobD [Isoalcanivorax beigongshangi]|uniref:threonine-phosphate decarboxylase n=1 Tax=Isoalcanivorax beigongshangi TaxID=3238810 RepID=A0ABV4AF02_9GAMM
MTGLRHGGQLAAAAAHYRIPLHKWLDLSTGINPEGWPVPALAAEVWQRLPDMNDGLDAVLADWAGAPADAYCVPLPGSQAAIQLLPRLRAAARVGVPVPGYAEHAHRWRSAGHEVVELNSAVEVDIALPQLDVLVLVQPNNPTGALWPAAQLRSWHQQLATRGGWLVVDEAFMDPIAAPQSLAGASGAPGLVVLRSLGKFFGLAGLRSGLALTDRALGAALAAELGPWAVSGPARSLVRQAVADRTWQVQTARNLQRAQARLVHLLEQAGLTVAGSTPLFCYVPHPAAVFVADELARQGILVRHWDAAENGGQAALRFGLPPADAGQWQRLAQALRTIR